MAVEETIQFAAIAEDEFGNEIPSSFDWAMSGEGGFIGEDGLFTADTTAGDFVDIVEASIQGSSGDLTGATSFTITPGLVSKIVIDPLFSTLEFGESQSFSFKTFDKFENETTEALTVWSVAPEIGKIDPTGTFTAGTVSGGFPGSVQLEAVDGSTRISAAVDVEVLPGALAEIEVEPNSAVVLGGTSIQLTATGLDRYANEIPRLAFIWESSGGEITNRGLFTATGTGGSYEGRGEGVIRR